MSPPSIETQIITHCIPRIEVYHVTEHELDAIEKGYTQVSQDLTFSVAAISILISVGLALLSGNFSQGVSAFLWGAVLVSVVVAIYTGAKWWRIRNTVPSAIAAIRSRRVEPE